jgi:hypothetical protein
MLPGNKPRDQVALASHQLRYTADAEWSVNKGISECDWKEAAAPLTCRAQMGEGGCRPPAPIWLSKQIAALNLMEESA